MPLLENLHPTPERRCPIGAMGTPPFSSGNGCQTGYSLPNNGMVPVEVNGDYVIEWGAHGSRMGYQDVTTQSR